jgi:hypothetical protein
MEPSPRLGGQTAAFGGTSAMLSPVISGIIGGTGDS